MMKSMFLLRGLFSPALQQAYLVEIHILAQKETFPSEMRLPEQTNQDCRGDSRM
jgi:hypothetical protein